ncbi:MAG: redoxin domain-containing protein [Acidobacteriota bacterium]
MQRTTLTNPRLTSLAVAACLFGGIATIASEPESHDDHAVAVSAATAAPPHPSSPSGPAVLESTNLIGLRIPTTDGEIVRLGLENGARPVALIFVNDGCTISRRYVPRLNELAVRAEELGVDLYAVVSDPAITPRAARAFRDEYQLEPPLLFDSNGELARQLLPEIVPSAFVVDLAGRVTYRGRIDDRFPSLTRIRHGVRSHDLLRAVEAVAAGKVEAPIRTQAVGCVFSGWSERQDAPTYAANIAPILNANCVECHRSGGVAPFALDTFEDAKRWSPMISDMTRLGLMPPWRAERGFGNFREERFLSEHQIDLLERWDRSGTLRGDSEQQLPAPRFESSTWELGPPDLVLTMPAAYEVPADGQDIYRYFVLPMELERDAVVVAMDFKPGDPTVVHHCNYFVDYSGRARKLDRKDAEEGFSVFGTGGFMSYDGANALGAWAPGVAPYQLPEGRGFDLPRGGDIVLEVHYHLTGKATRDQSSVAFYFAKGPVKRGVSGLFVGTQDVDIPAGDSDYWREVTMDVTGDMRLVDIAPHMHYLGRESRVTAVLPDGVELPLLHVTDWDLRWQGIYTYRQPVEIPAGSTLTARFRFDNSAANPANPSSPAKRVGWGWGSDEEMAELYLTVIPEDGAAEARLQRAARASWIRSASPASPREATAAGRLSDRSIGDRP